MKQKLIPFLLLLTLFLTAGAVLADGKRDTARIQVSLAPGPSGERHPMVQGSCKLDTATGDVVTIYIQAPDGYIAPSPFQNGRIITSAGQVHWVEHIAARGDGLYTLVCQRSTASGQVIGAAYAHLDYVTPKP
ncbi:MAG: hypothetical protein KIT87_25415 [Anaerolineae bacterium]|nr:hypothetical protein [Anaerolineae bacterium]